MNELFNKINSISPISEVAENALRSICTKVSYKKGSDVQPVGHTCKTLYFVKKGALRIYYFKNVTEITESFEFENTFVARVESLFSGKPSRKAIQAIEDCELVAINSIKLFELYDIHHDIERLARKIFEAAYVNTINRIESLQFHTADERYRNLLSDHPDILLRVPLKHIASYLGITPESLSRIRAGI